jgi:hypothetical protein
MSMIAIAEFESTISAAGSPSRPASRAVERPDQRQREHASHSFTTGVESSMSRAAGRDHLSRVSGTFRGKSAS